jgi:CheY-like chemotaxis protein
MTTVPHINRVLLIDDEVVDLMIYKRVLNKSGMIDEVKSFSYAEEALQYLAESEGNGVDLIFLDINMPRMNGFEFLEAYQKAIGSGKSVPVMIMLTTSLAESDRERAEACNLVKGFFNKPLTVEQVLEASQLVAAS